MLSFTQKGDFKNLSRFLKITSQQKIYDPVERLARTGQEALARYTPKDSGITSDSWGYEIERDGKKVSIQWFNRNVNQGHNIAILLQYGHGTGTGGYVQGRDYINPTMKPIFDYIADAVWKEVTSA